MERAKPSSYSTYQVGREEYSETKAQRQIIGDEDIRDDLVYTTISPPGNIKADTYYTSTHMLQGTVSEDELQVINILKGLRERLRDVDTKLMEREMEKDKILEDINYLTQRQKNLTKSVSRKKGSLESFEKTLKESESAFSKIIESTRTLLQVVKKETAALSRSTMNK
eukprot:TRINITY_DN3006_c0_g1_i6.p1 TRINITY_DN3006_c0_g1~~TRINITY_DN3006_c0_g1_i6.p1  ORF type:complete len:168 (+),score=34.86 TRINITY_DN3006_c0_g1_i6:83-586(+)